MKWLSLAGLLSLLGGGPASANMILTLQAGVGSVIIIDGQPAGAVSADGYVSTTADPDGLVNGIISYNGSVGPFTTNVSTAVSKPNIGPARIDLNSISVTSAGGGQLYLSLTDTDFLFGGAGDSLTLTNDLGGVTDGSVDAAGTVDLANMEFGIGPITPILGPLGPGPVSGTASVGFLGTGNPFSLYEEVIVTHTAAGQVTSFNKVLMVTPEPGTLLLLGSGLVGLAVQGRRKPTH